MSDTRSIQQVLETVRRRARGNQMLQALVDGLTGLLGAWLALALWNALMPLSLAIGWPVWLAVSIGVVGYRVARLGGAEPLWRSARRTDRAADLHDELISAWWFSRQERADDWVGLHLDRASDTARTLDASRLVPFEKPRRLVAPALLALGLVAVWSLPVPRVFDDLAQRISELDLMGGEELAEEPLAALEELGDRQADPETLLPDEQDDEMLVPMEEQAEQAGENALEEGEEGEPQEGEQQQEGDQEGEPGEQTEGDPAEAEESEEMSSEAEGEPSADPSASQDEGEGESTEETGPMLPGGEEVFLQEGGEDVEQQPMSDEEMGHATREGGGEEMLEEGEVTALDVQLEQEILAVPEDIAEPEDEEKEELITRAEQSFLDFEQIEQPQEYALQELLQAETIPWRYRQLVLTYFQRMRERDNQQPPRSGEGRQPPRSPR